MINRAVIGNGPVRAASDARNDYTMASRTAVLTEIEGADRCRDSPCRGVGIGANLIQTPSDVLGFLRVNPRPE
jgi:hypothetical protein